MNVAIVSTLRYKIPSEFTSVKVENQLNGHTCYHLLSRSTGSALLRSEIAPSPLVQSLFWGVPANLLELWLYYVNRAFRACGNGRVIFRFYSLANIFFSIRTKYKKKGLVVCVNYITLTISTQNDENEDLSSIIIS